MTDDLTLGSPPAKKKFALWAKILIGMLLGVLVGLLFKETAVELKPIGTLFINAIKMLIVPLVFCSLVSGVTSMQDSQKLGRIGIKAFCLYLATTFVAIAVGLAFSIIAEPGVGLNMVATAVESQQVSSPSIIQTFLNLIPTNPVDALASGNILQIIIFALFFGVALNLCGDKGRLTIDLIDSLAEGTYKLTGMVMTLAPYGVFGLMAWTTGKYGLDVLLPLLKVVLLIYLACIFHVLFVYAPIIRIFAKLNPLRYLKGVVNPAFVGFSTCSSSGTLPITIKAAREEMGVSKGISSFVLPLGATINMDGTAIYQGVAAVFIAQAFGIDLSTGDYFTIIVTATLASIGTASVPGAGLIMLSLIFTSIGLPLEGLAIIAGVDRILDMARTTVNVCGDLMVSLLVAKSEKEIDEDVFNKSAA